MVLSLRLVQATRFLSGEKVKAVVLKVRALSIKSLPALHRGID